jgi:hypothetical protein
VTLEATGAACSAAGAWGGCASIGACVGFGAGVSAAVANPATENANATAIITEKNFFISFPSKGVF